LLESDTQMADVLEPIPDTPGALYGERNPDAISLTLPHNQGDVFRDVSISGQITTVILFMHPCTMRQGARVRDEVTVVEVAQRSHKK